jgi:hypothetical protein
VCAVAYVQHIVIGKGLSIFSFTLPDAAQEPVARMDISVSDQYSMSGSVGREASTTWRERAYSVDDAPIATMVAGIWTFSTVVLP